jgi:hypothetical protein
MLMSKAGNGSSAGAIENPAAILGNEPHAVAPDGLGRRFAQASMQHAAVAGAHDIQPFSAKFSLGKNPSEAAASNSGRIGSDGKALQSSLRGEDFGCGWAM